MHIRTAVIPAAGHGTRLRPLTLVAPKEMLPLGGKPAGEYIVEELHDVGVNSIIFVVSPSKQAIREYFGESACNGDVNIKYIVQETQKGLADSILQAEKEVGDEHFIVALGDTVMISRQRPAPLARLIEAYQANPAFAAISVERVPMADAHMYGMVKPISDVGDRAFEIADLVEKPSIDECPSDYAIGGRYIFSPGIFDCIHRTPPGMGGEQQITDAIKLGLSEGGRVWCAPLLDGENRYDIGNLKIYCEAFAAMCMLDDALAASVLKAVRHGA